MFNIYCYIDICVIERVEQAKFQNSKNWGRWVWVNISIKAILWFTRGLEGDEIPKLF